MAHVAQYKKDRVTEFVDLINQYPIIGTVNMKGMPASSIQKMRGQLRKEVVIKMTKKRLIKKAFEQVKDSKKGIEKLEEYLHGMPALLFTKENPFKLYSTLQKSKSPAPAKAGQIAPKDIIVPAGPTPFAPGPIISELGSIGIKAGVEGGKVTVKEDCVVAKEGEEISAKAAEILTRLGIEPMEIGLDLTAVYEEGNIFDKKVLHIDEAEFMQKIHDACSWALNLSVEAAYLTKDNIELLITKTFKDSKGLALETNFMADAVAEELVMKAERQMLALKDTANITVEEKKEEGKAEEKKEEPKEPKAEKTLEELKAEKEPEEIGPKPQEDAIENVPHKETKSEKLEKEVKDLKEDVEKKEQDIKEDEKKIQEEKGEKKEDLVKEVVELTSEVLEEKEEIKEKTEEAKEEFKKEEPVIESVTPAVSEEELKKKIEEDIKKVEEAEKILEKEAKIIETKHPEQKQEIEKEIKETKKEVEDVKKEKKDMEKVEDLYETLKKKGTLRGEAVKFAQTSKKEDKKSDIPTVVELAIRNAKKDDSQEKVPSAYELMQKKKNKSS